MPRSQADTSYPTAVVLAMRLVHELFELARGDLDMVDAVLFLSVLQANIGQITASPALQKRYATLDLSPPDGERRPISILRLSAAVRLPFETVRRRISRLAGQGDLTLTARGVIITQQQLQNQPGSRILGEMYEVLGAAYPRLETLKFFDAAPPRAGVADSVCAPEVPPLRAVSRVAGDFGLRMLDLANREFGSVNRGWLMTILMELNLRPATQAAVAGAGPAEVRRDLLQSLQPVRIARLSEAVGMNAETVRRRLSILQAEGHCVRTDDGFVATADALHVSLDIHRSERERNLRRLYRQLDELGCVAGWRVEPAVARPA